MNPMPDSFKHQKLDSLTNRCCASVFSSMCGEVQPGFLREQESRCKIFCVKQPLIPG
jgi:hypothetical protein